MWLRSPIVRFLWPAVFLPFFYHCGCRSLEPVATVRNGTLLGIHNVQYNQDFFLGIPYAQPPMRELRFHRPEPLNASWESPRLAKSYGFWCHSAPLSLPGYTQKGFPHEESEDCLTLNVIRPSRKGSSAPLPILVYIYGGGLQEGGSADQRYNMSFLVQESVAMGTPVIGVSFNYRASGFGFLSGRAINESRTANLGLYDQRTALHWIQENIAAFGGDPSRVTIQGESSGALSVGYHLLAYGGRDDRLFRAAITESGNPLSSASLIPLDEQESMFQGVLHVAGCAGAEKSLDCLRQAPVDSLRAAFQQKFFFPVIDGEIIAGFPSVALKQGDFVKVPLLIGSNTNEGTGYIASGSFGAINSPADFRAVITGFGPGNYLANETIDALVQGYLQLPPDEVQADLGTVLMSPGLKYGSLYGHSTFYIGDYLFNAPKRYSAQMWAEYGVNVYSYRFNVVPSGISPEVLGVAHFQEVAFVFANLDGVGYNINPLASSNKQVESQLRNVSHLMTRMWLSFATTLSPNNHQLSDSAIRWPLYQESGANIVFNLQNTTVEPDTWRSGVIERIVDAFGEYRF